MPQLHADAEPRPLRARHWLIATALVVIATVAQLYRSNIRPWHAWWAEDGAVFYPDALRYSFPRTLTLVYNGYLQTVVRPITEVASWWPLSAAPAVLAVGTDACIAILAVYVWVASRPTFRHAWAPIVVGASLVLLPQAGKETVSSVADLHWYLDVACFWAVWRPLPHRSAMISSVVVVLLATLSDPLAALTAFPAVVALVASRADRRPRLVVIGALVVGTAVQLVANHGSQPYRDPMAALTILRFYVIRVIEAIVVGERAVAGVYGDTGLALAIVVTVVVAALGIAALVRVGLAASVGPVVCVLLSGAFTVVCLRYRGAVAVTGGGLIDGSRYTVVPALFLWAATVMLLDRLATATRRSNVLLGMCAVLVTASVVANWDTINVRDGAPSWSAQLAEARQRCALAAQDRPPLLPIRVADINAPDKRAGPDDVTFVTAPIEGGFHDFVIVVPCDRVGH